MITLRQVLAFTRPTSVVCLFWMANQSLAQDRDWPQWRGPNRDGVVVNSPKLMDAWPTNGPALLWKSEYIPSFMCGGCASPVVADGKVFLYVNWKKPIEGGTKYHLINTDRLVKAGWLPDLPEALAQKIEAARVSTNRPATSTRAPDWAALNAPTEADLDAFLKKNADLDNYSKAFIATLDPADAKTYGAYIRRRFCMPLKSEMKAYTWDDLVKLSKLRDLAFETEHEWRAKTREININTYYGGTPYDYMNSWILANTMYDTIICLDAASGKTLWKKEFLEDKAVFTHLWDTVPGGGFSYYGVSCTPAIDNGRCYAAGAMGLYCLSVKDGSVLWQVKTELAQSSPLVASGIVYQYDSAYSAETGKQIWSNPELRGCNPRLVDATLWNVGGTNYVIAPGNKGWCCLNMDTGKILWKLEDAPPTIFAPPVISGEILAVLAGSNPKTMRGYKVSATGAELLWKHRFGQPGDWCSFLAWKDHVYLASNTNETGPSTLRCLDLKTGDVKWISPVYTDTEGGTSQPIAADGKLFFTIGSPHQAANQYGGRPPSTLTFEMEMVSANPEGKYTRLGKFHPEICPMASPALVDGRLYVRSEKCVACYDLRAQ